MPFLKPEMVHAVDVVTQPFDGGDDVTTYVALGAAAALHVKPTAAFLATTAFTSGASGGTPAVTVVVAGGLVPSLFAPVTVMVYVEPSVRPMRVHELPPTVLHDALPGVATAV